MHGSRPLVGISTRHDLDTERFYLPRFYSEAVEAVGGLPVLLPLHPSAQYIAQVAERLDGVLLPGSASDMDPLKYGREPHRGLKEVHPLRDETDLLLLKVAEHRGLPLLAICFGMQALNVFRGGSLIQDIQATVAEAVKHEQGAPRDRRSHTISIKPGSRLAGLAKKRSVVVNSHHHQAVEHLGDHLGATGWSADGLIEAVEDDREGRWVVGVQWHPEIAWRDDELSEGLFRAFVTACREAASGRVR